MYGNNVRTDAISVTYMCLTKLLHRFLLLKWQIFKMKVTERGLIVVTRETVHNISEVEMNFGFSCMTISRVYCEYHISGKVSNYQYQYCHKKNPERTARSTINEII